jgi:hypothetical protein
MPAGSATLAASRPGELMTLTSPTSSQHLDDATFSMAVALSHGGR